MKKTEKTALTAALFAAALNFVPTSTNALSEGSFGDLTAALNRDAVQEVGEEMQGAYGPPPQYTETVETAETTTIVTNENGFDVINSTFKTQPSYGPPVTNTSSETTMTQTTTAYPQPVYGPPPAYDTTEPEESTKKTTTATTPFLPSFMAGDIDSDGKVTAFDMVKMRQIMNGQYYPNGYEMAASDLNGDDVVGMADMLLLQRYLMGRIDDPRDRYMSETEAEMELNEEFGTPVYPMYGPPPDFTIDPVTTAPNDVVTETTTNFTAVYSAPTIKYTTTTTTTAVEEPYDPVKTVQTEMADVYGPPSWFSEKE